jgi:hypothetical protein
MTRGDDGRRDRARDGADVARRRDSDGRAVAAALKLRRLEEVQFGPMRASRCSPRPASSTVSSTGRGDYDLANRQVGVELAVLEHQADPLPPAPRCPAGIDTQHPHLAGGAPSVVLEDLDGGRLPGGVGAEDPRSMALPKT